MNKYGLLILFVLLNGKGFCQTYTLDECIQTAMASNTDVQTTKNDLLSKQLNLKQSWWAILPEVNASWNINKIYGTAFDNVSFQRIQKATTTSFPSLDANINLFNGFRLFHQQKAAKEEVTSQEYSLKLKETEIVLSVIEIFYNCQLAEKSIEIYTNRVKALESMEKMALIKKNNGAGSNSDYYTVLAQLESERALLIEGKSNFLTNKAKLLSLMKKNYSDSVKFSYLDINLSITSYSTDQVYKTATENNASLKSFEHTLMAQKMTKNQLYSGFFPRVIVGGSLASNYSSNGIFDFTTGTVSYPSYFEQMRLNNYQVVGLTVQIPIFNRFSTTTSVKQATLNYENKKLGYEQEKLNLYNQSAQLCGQYALLVQKEKSLNNALNAAQDAHKQADLQYRAGEIDFYVYLNALTKMNQCELDVVRNKVELYLTSKRIDGLMGK